MKVEDLYYVTPSGKTTIFYSSVHAFRDGNVKVNNEWWESDEETAAFILAGKLKYEQLRLVVSQEEIDTMLEQALKNTKFKDIANEALNSTLETLKEDITLVTNSFKRAIPRVQEAIEEISKSTASTNIFNKVIDNTSKTIDEVKSSLPSTDEIKGTLKHVELELSSAKKEFTEITSKLKELFK